jgi:hypothetical protein
MMELHRNLIVRVGISIPIFGRSRKRGGTGGQEWFKKLQAFNFSMSQDF